MAALKNSRHEAFARAVVEGMSQTDAYLRAGYKAKGHAAESAASRLLSDVEVSARVAELKAAAAAGTVMTANEVLEELSAIARERALVQPRDRVGALELLGKHHKLFTDKHEHTGKNGGPMETREVEDVSDLEVARRLAYLLHLGDKALSKTEGAGG